MLMMMHQQQQQLKLLSQLQRQLQGHTLVGARGRGSQGGGQRTCGGESGERKECLAAVSFSPSLSSKSNSANWSLTTAGRLSTATRGTVDVIVPRGFSVVNTDAAITLVAATQAAAGDDILHGEKEGEGTQRQQQHQSS